jgi:hypothetical protein
VGCQDFILDEQVVSNFVWAMIPIEGDQTPLIGDASH